MTGSQRNPADRSDGLLGLYMSYLKSSGPPSPCRPDDSPWAARFKGIFAGTIFFLDIFFVGIWTHEKGTFCEISGWHAAQLRQCCTARFPHSLEADFRSEMQHLSVFFLCVAFWQENSRGWGPRIMIAIISFIYTHHTVILLALYVFSYMNVKMSKKNALISPTMKNALLYEAIAGVWKTAKT